MYKSYFFSGIAAALLAGHAFAADEWPQFRGPDGQGHSDAVGLPLTWSETENIKWKCAIPGTGWSSPVISGNLVWMTTATEEGKSLRAVCVDLATGKLLKDVEVFHRETPEAIHGMNSHASPSPVIEAGRLYVYFGNCGVACLSAETGAILWQRQDIAVDHDKMGPGSSPALWHDKLIFACDGKTAQFVIALNKQTGETVWKTNRTYKDGKVPRPSAAFCTPLLVNVKGVDEAIIPGPNRVFAYDPDTGKELWCVTYFGFSESAKPVYGNGLVYVCTGNGGPALLAIRPEGTGDITETGVVWKMAKQVPNMPSPVLVGNRLYAMHDEAGTAYCLDALTGNDIWREKMGGKYAASLLAAEGRVYFFDRDGTTKVIEVGDSFKVLATNKLESGFMASAAVAGKALVLRTKTHLYRVEQ